MSAFNRFVAATKRTAKKISNKTEEVFDSAAHSFKIKNLEMKMDELYEELGRIVYRDLHIDEDLEEQKMQIVAELDGLFDRIALLKEEMLKNKKKGEEPKEAAEEATEATTEAPEQAAEAEAPATEPAAE